MLYLEDYLEMIEHLPQELRDRFTDMREMDLSIHNNMDELEKRVKIFFSDCKRYPADNLPQNVDAEFQAIRKEYYKTLEDADEKVHLASQMYDLVDKYLRRLDSELHKFKCELEADNKGITEVLEKRSLELDTPNTTPSISSLQQKENRYESVGSSNFRYTRPRSEKRRDSSASLPSQFSEKRQAVAVVPPPALIETRHAAAAAQVTPPVTSSISYNLGHTLGAGPAIAAAASQAIAATQQVYLTRPPEREWPALNSDANIAIKTECAIVRCAEFGSGQNSASDCGRLASYPHQMQQGRRTASLKASYEAINTGGHGHEFSIGRELAGAAQTAIQAIQQDHANNKNKKKKWSNNSSSSSSASTVVQSVIPTTIVAPVPESPSIEVSSQNAEVTDGEWTYDPNEPRYCLCNQVSYGDMVACDNEDCPSEWFHYPCVGITAPPKGKWYCPQCTASMKRRGGRKN